MSIIESAEPTYPYSPGLEGVPAGISKISDIDSEHSSLKYRGYNVHDLAEFGSFEETAYLLINEKLPNKEELAEFKKILGAERDVPEGVYAGLKALPKSAHPMDYVRTAYSMLAPFDPDYLVPSTDHDANVRKAIRMLAKASTVVANGHRIQLGMEVKRPNPDLSIAESFLELMSDDPFDEFTSKVMDASLTLYAEHGFNASTFANRVCVSTLSDLYSGIVTGICTLRGPLHGGANEAAMRMILSIGEPSGAEAWIRDALATKKKIMGFGHREYKKGDSRAFYMSKIAKDIGKRKGNTKFGEIADILERVMLEEKGLYPNVDFPTGYAYYLLGIPIDLYTPIFVMARIAGYSAHAIEQLSANRLIRPKAIYEGDKNLKFIPLNAR